MWRRPRLTHTDPKAFIGARAIACLAAAFAGDGGCDTGQQVAQLRQLGNDDADWCASMDQLAAQLAADGTIDDLAQRLGLEKGITGYIYHTVPMVVFTVLKYRKSPAAGLEALYRCGGDTDTTGAIAGALFGIANGPDAFPAPWLDGIHNGPITLPVLRRAAAALASPGAAPIRWAWPLVPFRNLLFLLIVLAHGFRRLLP